MGGPHWRFSKWLSKRTALALHHAQTVWLFICNDINSMIIPTMSFVTTSALVEPLSGSPPPSGSKFAISFVAATLWSCTNLLLFCLHNQRQPAAIEEDRYNKPWRPLPSKRVAPDQIVTFFIFGYPMVMAFSAQFGGLTESIFLGLLTVSYNELGGGNTTLFRNLLNAGGVVLYYNGAFKVFTTTSGQRLDIQDGTLLVWLGIIGFIIFTTIHVQDLRDQEGDAKRGRRTIPLVYGDLACRISVTIAIAFWSLMVPMFWRATLAGYVIPLGQGAWLMHRALLIRTADGDDKTFKFWSLWMMSLLLTPITKKLI